MRRLKYLNLPLMLVAYFSINQVSAAKLQDNFFCDANHGKLDFKLKDSDSYTITKGQHLKGVWQAVDNKYSGCINVVAGRKNSYDNQLWVQKEILRQQLAWVPAAMTSANKKWINSYPEKLNFGVMGTLSYTLNDLTVFCDNVIIAQQHQSGVFQSSNIWWVFNNDKTMSHYLKCHDEFGNDYPLYLSPSKNNCNYCVAFSFDKPSQSN